MLQRPLVSLAPPRTRVFIHPLFLRRTAQTSSEGEGNSVSATGPPVLSLPGGGGTKVLSHGRFSRSVKPRVAAMVAQALGCATGLCVTERWLLLQDMAMGGSHATCYLHPKMETLHRTQLMSDEATASLMV